MLWEMIFISRIYVKKAKSPSQVRIADNSIMSHNEAIEGLSIELGGV